MKRVISAIMAAVLCCLLMVTVSAEKSNGVKETYLNNNEWVKLSDNTKGPRYFVDEKGNPVDFYGMARCQAHATQEDILYALTGGVDRLTQEYQDLGCNFMRLAIEFGSLCGGEKKTEEQINEFISYRVDPDVQAIIRNGMYVMLDIHMYPPAMESVKQVTDYARDYFLPFTIQLAKYYRDEPRIAVIELWNEPYAADQMGLGFDQKEWNEQVRQYYIDAIKEVRKVDTRHTLLVSDWNAGWGGALPETWHGYFDKVDPCNNTCFSVHASKDQLDPGNFTWYSGIWKSWSNDYNICLLMGEIETEGGISTEKGIQNLIDYLTENKSKYHFTAVLWRPHGDEYRKVWGTNGWAKKYTTPVGASARYVVEAECQTDSPIAKVTKDVRLSGGHDFGTGISINKGAAQGAYYNADFIHNNIVYAPGSYTMMVKANGDATHNGDFIVGIASPSGIITQLARFEGRDSGMEPYYQTFSFTASEQIANVVFMGCENSKDSAWIDRVILVGQESDNETTRRNKVTIQTPTMVKLLNGKQIKPDLTGQSIPGSVSNDSANNHSDSGNQNYVDGAGSKRIEETHYVTEGDTEITQPGKNKLITYLKNKTNVKSIRNLWIALIIAAGLVVLTGAGILTTVLVKRSKEKKGEEQ